MNPRAAFVLTAALTIPTTVAFAQATKAPAPWKKEPTAVFGLRFGEQLSPDDIRSCGGVQVETEPAKIGFCRIGRYYANSRLAVSAFPISSIEAGSLNLEDNVPKSLLLTGNQKNYRTMRDVLIERYGPPTVRKQSSVRTMAGADFPSESLIWVGRELTLTLDERLGTVNEFGVLFLHQPAAQRDEKLRQDQVKSEAAKM